MEFRRLTFLKNYFLLIVLMIILVAGMLGWIVNARLDSFREYHFNISHEALSGVEKQTAFYIAEKHRMVEMFVSDHLDKIRDLAADPDNQELHEAFGAELTSHFPDHFAFSIADEWGTPLFEDFDGLISELCLSDVKLFSKGNSVYSPYIHPNTEGYHFDIMVRYGKNGTEGIFFVSFLAEVLGEIISSIQSLDHQIMLVLPERQDLIEVVAGGARNRLVRDDYRLSGTERANILMRHEITGTRWQAIDLHDPALFARYRNKLIAESALIFSVFTALSLFLMIRLRREERQREIAVKQKQELMSVVSHEFRAPASVIKSALELVVDGTLGEVQEEVKKYVGMALGNTKRLLLLVNDFLDIQKIESGNFQLNKQKSQLSSIVTDAVLRNKLYADQFSVQYVLKLPLCNDPVFCDEYRIEQVVTNLLTNAAKYGAENDTIEVSVVRIGSRLRVSVADHGSGIPDEFRPRVFKKFAMGHRRNLDQEVKSTGLGLSIAKAIVEQHGGTIGFDTKSKTDSQSKSGTTFWFELPVFNN